MIEIVSHIEKAHVWDANPFVTGNLKEVIAGSNNRMAFRRTQGVLDQARYIVSRCP
jgi:hypothetical protein